jgi:uncharacterized protein YkwD
MLTFAVSVAATQSSIRLPDRRLTDDELQAWITDYFELGAAVEFELEVMRLVNQVRADNNLALLEVDEPLMLAARFYTQTMDNLNTGLGHNRGPYRVEDATHGASAAVAGLFGGRLRWTGGNGAGGHRTPEAVVQGWIESTGHMTYMLSPEHRYIGAGRFGNFTYMFLSDNPSNGCVIGKHNLNEWAETDSPGCVEPGSRIRGCTVCEFAEVEELPPLGHEWEEWVVTVPPCFEENGVRERVCMDCDVAETRPVRRLIHPFDKGDVNGNGEIDLNDALEILRYLVDLPSVIDYCADGRNAAQITLISIADDTIALADAMQVLRYLVWLPTSLD